MTGQLLDPVSKPIWCLDWCIASFLTWLGPDISKLLGQNKSINLLKGPFSGQENCLKVKKVLYGQRSCWKKVLLPGIHKNRCNNCFFYQHLLQSIYKLALVPNHYTGLKPGIWSKRKVWVDDWTMIWSCFLFPIRCHITIKLIHTNMVVYVSVFWESSFPKYVQNDLLVFSSRGIPHLKDSFRIHFLAHVSLKWALHWLQGWVGWNTY